MLTVLTCTFVFTYFFMSLNFYYGFEFILRVKKAARVLGK